MRRRWGTRSLCALLVLSLGGCEEASTEIDGGTADAAVRSDAGQAGPDPLRYYPNRLKAAADALAAAFPAGTDVTQIPVDVVINKYQPFWGPCGIGVQRGAIDLGSPPARMQGTTNFDAADQALILDGLVTSMATTGIAVTSIDDAVLSPAIDRAVGAGVNVFTFDSDAPSSMRTFYLGTINFTAGETAGQAMVDALGADGGEVALFSPNTTTANAMERIAGIEAAFAAAGNVHVVEIYEDGDDDTVAEANVRRALTDHPNLRGAIGIFAHDGPAAIRVLEAEGRTDDVRVVAFDLHPETLEAIENSAVAGAIGQRPYWFGYLAVHILVAMEVLGVDATMAILRGGSDPWVVDDANGRPTFDTGTDVLTPDGLGDYNAYLESLGIPTG